MNPGNNEPQNSPPKEQTTAENQPIPEQNQPAGAVPPGTEANVIGVYEMLWDCPACGTKKLLGVTHKFCPNCGHPQDAKYRYFPSEEEQIAVKDHLYYGVDKICPACHAPNSANAEFCTQCGSPLEGAQQVTLRQEQVRGDGFTFASETKADAKRERDTASSPIPKPEKLPRPPFWKTRLGIGLMAGGSALFAFIATALFWNKTVEVNVTGHTWERVINIEDYNWRSRSDWCDTMPSDGVVTARSREIRSYTQVADGESCSNKRVDQGDGSFRVERVCTTNYKDVPVYDTKCYYRVLRWEFKRKAKSNGTNATDEPYWPQTNIQACSITSPGCEREGGREQTYTVHFKNTTDGSTYKCEFEQSKWKSFGLEQRYTGKAGVIFNNLKCNTLNIGT